MSKTILIVGQLPDPHIEAVEREIHNLGAQVVVFDRLKPSEQALSFHLDGRVNQGWLQSDGSTIDLTTICGVWWRVKPYTLGELSGEAPPLTVSFADREWRSTLDSLPVYTPDALWVNPRTSDLMARNKPYQLAKATHIGFSIPQTLISNNPNDATDFLDLKPGEYVYKPLTWYFEPPNHLLFTSLVDTGQVQEDPDSLRVAPGIFQGRIPKAYELRITVIGEQVFAVRIDSQADEKTKLDWRRRQRALEYSPYHLTKTIEDRIRQMNQRLGLRFGAYDFIVTPEGDIVFLEVNPVGQWLWLEIATGLEMTRALANYLISG